MYRNDHNRGSGYNTKRAHALAARDFLFWQRVDRPYDIRQLVRVLAAPDRVDVLRGVRGHTVTAGAMRDRSDNSHKGLVSLINCRLIRTLFQLVPVP